MEMNGQLHAPAALPPQNPITYWRAKASLDGYWEEKISCFYWNLNPRNITVMQMRKTKIQGRSKVFVHEIEEWLQKITNKDLQAYIWWKISECIEVWETVQKMAVKSEQACAWSVAVRWCSIWARIMFSFPMWVSWTNITSISED